MGGRGRQGLLAVTAQAIATDSHNAVENEQHTLHKRTFPCTKDE